MRNLGKSGPSPRYLFVIPPVRAPTGGVNVIVWVIEKLRERGHDAVALLGRKDGALFSRPISAPQFYSPELDRLFRQGFARRGLRTRIRQVANHWVMTLLSLLGLKASLRQWDGRPDDILVLPEFMYPELAAILGDHPHVLFVQNGIILFEDILRDPDLLFARPVRASAFLSASQACATAVQTVFGRESPILVLPVCRPNLTFNPDKKVQIAYMPRRRHAEVRIMEQLIRAHPELAGIPLVSIHNVPEEEAHRIIRDSLIFLAFSEKEGFGLPPAEAMATGSLVIGYTGLGGDEYFTAETGFPILDGDLVAFMNTLIEVVQSWRSAPEKLQAKRRAASEFMWRTYSESLAIESLDVAWSEINDAFLRR